MLLILLKIKGQEGKWLLKKLMELLFLCDVFYWFKMGFFVFLVKWLCGLFVEWVRNVIFGLIFVEIGFFNCDILCSMFE